MPTDASFPQNSTVTMTLDSNFMLYGAYRALANWQMQGIVDAIDRPSFEPRPKVPVVR
jgi:hypothetical protein